MKKKSKSIGITDSGLGGYTFFDALTKTFPEASFTLIVDQANAPFGEKSQSELLEIGRNLIKSFRKKQIYTVLIGCNTLSATVLPQLRKEFEDMELISIIDLTIEQVPQTSKRILVIATSATINKKAYSEELSKQVKHAWIEELATPKLVPLIEGLADDTDIYEVLDEYLSHRSKVDTIVLGCTHYPMIKKQIKKFTKAKLIDAISGAIDYFNEKELPVGQSEVYTSLDAQRLQRQVYQLFRDEIQVKEITL